MAFGGGQRSPQWQAEDAARRVEKSRAINNQIFAYYRLRPIKIKKHGPCPFALKANQELLARIAPWLPKKIPHWMRPV